MHVFPSARFWLGLVYVTFPLGLILYGWNDIADRDIDQCNPRKGLENSNLFAALEMRAERDRVVEYGLSMVTATLVRQR